jgi:hypothetical protein
LAFIMKNKNSILAIVGVLVTVCSIFLTITAIMAHQKENMLMTKEVSPAIEM